MHDYLLQSGINCVRLVGGMTMNARDAAIERFTEDPDCRILLMSLKAGGVALNLMVASHVSECPFTEKNYFAQTSPVINLLDHLTFVVRNDIIGLPLLRK